jgi:hypothetical protein
MNTCLGFWSLEKSVFNYTTPDAISQPNPVNPVGCSLAKSEQKTCRAIHVEHWVHPLCTTSVLLHSSHRLGDCIEDHHHAIFVFKSLVLLFRSVAIGLLDTRSNGLAVTLLHMGCHFRNRAVWLFLSRIVIPSRAYGLNLTMLDADDYFCVNIENKIV